jgi:hypothetical protein
MEVLAIKLARERKREDIQWIQVLVPLRHLTLNLNICGLRRCLGVGYGDEELSLEEGVFLITWDIINSKD